MNIKTSIAYFKATSGGDGVVDMELEPADLPVCIQFADEFSIFFLVDCGECFAMVQAKHLADAGISEETLLSIGRANLGSIAHNIEISKNDELFYFTGNGVFEASLLMVPEIWNAWLKEYCPNGYVAAIPARDILVVSDRENAKGIEKLVTVVERIWPDGDHLLSKSLFSYHQGKWHPFSNA